MDETTRAAMVSEMVSHGLFDPITAFEWVDRLAKEADLRQRELQIMESGNFHYLYLALSNDQRLPHQGRPTFFQDAGPFSRYDPKLNDYQSLTRISYCFELPEFPLHRLYRAIIRPPSGRYRNGSLEAMVGYAGDKELILAALQEKQIEVYHEASVEDLDEDVRHILPGIRTPSELDRLKWDLKDRWAKDRTKALGVQKHKHKHHHTGRVNVTGPSRVGVGFGGLLAGFGLGYLLG